MLAEDIRAEAGIDRAALPPQRRQLAIDTGLAVLVFVVVGTAITANLGAEAHYPGPAAYLFAALFGALVLVRRRWPLGALIVSSCALLGYYVLSYPPIGLAVPVAVALYSAAEQGRLRWAVGTAVALLLISTGFRVHEGDNLAYLLGFEFAGSAGLMVSVIVLGDAIRSRRGWRAELDRQARAAIVEREREAARQVERERLRIAREMHDTLGHTMSVISLHTDVAREALGDDPGAAERSLSSVRVACSSAMQELRATVRALREDTHGDTSSLATGLDQLDALADKVTGAGVDVKTRITGQVRPLPAIADTTAYRVLQESLSNVLKHSGASTVIIELDYTGKVVMLRVSDDGRAAHSPPEVSEGWGIVGMRERLALLGGSVETYVADGGGFVVEARIPAREQL